MKVDGVRRAVGETITIPGDIDRLYAAEKLQCEHAKEARQPARLSRAAAAKAIPGLAGQVTDAERELTRAEGRLTAARQELYRVQALANVEAKS